MKTLTTLLILLIFISLKGQDFELIPYRVKNKWGFANKSAKIKIKPKYDNVIPFSRGYSAFQMNGKWGFIGVTGEEVLPPKYDSVGEYFQGFYILDESSDEQIVSTGIQVFIDGKENFVDVNGNNLFDEKGPERLNIVYDDNENSTRYKNKVEYLRKNNLVGFKMKRSGFIVEPEYDTLIYSDTDVISLMGNEDPAYFIACKNGKWGIITTRNTIKLDFDYDYLIEKEYEDDILFKKDGKWGILNKSYATKIENKFDTIIISGNKYLTCQNNLWGVYGYNGKELIPLKFAKVTASSDDTGFYVYNENENIGFYNAEGQQLIPLEYQYLKKYRSRDGFKYKKDKNSKYIGYISSDLHVKIEAIYDEIEPFNNGYSKVVKNGKPGYINEAGKEFFKK